MAATTILLVEDETELIDLYHYVFASEGYTILKARDGQRAIEIYSQFHSNIHVVLMDLGLPKLDGKEVFKKLKQINPKVKVIFMSGYLDERLSSELIQAGGKALIRKPYSADVMIKNVRKLLQQ